MLAPRPGPRVVRLALLVLGCVLALGSVRAAAESESGSVPAENTSHVRTDAPWVTKTWEAVDEAIDAGDWRTAVRLLQQVIDETGDRDDPGAAAPYVVSVYGSVVYEGAWLVAQHRILGGGVPALEAYAAEYGAVARGLYERGIAARDPALIASVADRFLSLEEGRRAALLLADLALEVGDVDAAVGWLERLQDVEEVSREPAEALAGWRRARIRRTAAALARPERVEAVEALLTERAKPDASDEERYAPLPTEDRREEALPRGWPTTGGGPGRSLRPPALGTRFELVWFNTLEGGVRARDPAAERSRARPSPWHPPRGVVADGLVFVCDGGRVVVWEAETGRRICEPYVLENARGRHLRTVEEEDLRENLGLLEGHALTLGPRTTTGRAIYVSVPDPMAGYWDYVIPRDDRIEALWWDARERTLTYRWRNGGEFPLDAMPRGTRLYGAPLLYRDRLWVAGVRPSQGTEHEADAWLFGLSPDTGAVEVRTYLGSGVPVRGGRADEAIPSSPAGAHGRVVVVTSMGIVAAVDARTGRPQWLYRNDRGIVGASRLQRLEDDDDQRPRETGFVNGPPLLALQQVWFAPTDGPQLCCLFDRPRGPDRHLRRWRRNRRSGFFAFAAEQIVGLVPGRGPGSAPVLVLVGRGETSEGQPPAAIAQGIDALRPGWTWWRAIATTGDGPEPFGTALLTRGELLVPTRHGISIYGLEDGRDLATLDAASIPPRWRELLSADVPLSGNVIPVPGLGVIALSGSHAVYWRAVRR